jgi:hypothetical protein
LTIKTLNIVRFLAGDHAFNSNLLNE